MPRADRPETARRWATDRLIDLWVCYPAGLADADAPALADGLSLARADGARVALVLAPPAASGVAGVLARTADLVLDGPSAPSPRAVHQAAVQLGFEDVRRIGVLGAAPDALEAGHRCGAAAVIGLGPRSTGKPPLPSAAGTQRELLGAQPDLIVSVDSFGAADAERWGSRRSLRQLVLLNPGPTVVSDRIHRAVGGPDLCHREPEYGVLAARIEARLLQAAEAPAGWRAVLLAGSGTAAMEAMVAASTRPGKRLLVVRNGTYGERMAVMAQRHGLDHLTVDSEHWEPADPERIAAALDVDPEIDAVAVVQHETTTGLLNPLAAIATVVRERGRILAVDAISALGAEELPLADGGIDLVAGTANKCLQGLPGIAFVLLSPAAQARAKDARPASLYLDLATYLAAAERGAPPFTPSIPAAYGLLAALEELLDEGIVERRLRYGLRMARLDAALEEHGLRPVVAAPHRSATVRAFRLPDGVSYPALHDRLKEAGYVIYAGQGSGASEQFRVCLLGEIDIGAVDGFVAELRGILV
jgi:2-aminoethylphosphonate-pyruvate transaminase